MANTVEPVPGARARLLADDRSVLVSEVDGATLLALPPAEHELTVVCTQFGAATVERVATAGEVDVSGIRHDHVIGDTQHVIGYKLAIDTTGAVVAEGELVNVFYTHAYTGTVVAGDTGVVVGTDGNVLTTVPAMLPPGSWFVDFVHVAGKRTYPSKPESRPEVVSRAEVTASG